MTYEIVITPSAKADILETYAWLLENHPQTAEKWLWRISSSITSLRKFPERCPVSDESAAFDVEVRQLLCGDKRNVYRILFSITKAKVYILRVRATRQQRLIDQLEE